MEIAKTNRLFLGAASTDIVVADVQANSHAINSAINSAEEKQCKVLTLPPLALSGASCGHLFLYSTLTDACKKALRDILTQTANTSVLTAVGMPLKVKNGVIEVLAIIRSGKLLKFVQRQQVTDVFCTANQKTVDFFGEDVEISSNGILEIDGTTVAFCFASTISDIEKISVQADILSLHCQLPFEMGKQFTLLEAVKTLSKNTTVLLANCSHTESTANMLHFGKTIICSFGNVLKASAPFCGDLVTCDTLDKTDSNSFVIKPAFDERFPYLSGVTCEEVILAQAHSLAKRVKHTNAKALVLGVSGGLDSTLAVLTCAKACDLLCVPRSFVSAYSMPCFGTTSRTKSNAQKLCENLQVSFKEINISNSVSAHLKEIGHDNQTNNAYENSQARMRTMVLMDIANNKNGIMVGTGDLSEIMLGWATYNGDHISMYSLNGSVQKTTIRFVISEIAQKDTALKEVLLDILDTPISPELLPSDGNTILQETENIVGPYELHDFFTYHFLKSRLSPTEIFTLCNQAFSEKYDSQTVLKWLKMFFNRLFMSQFKRNCCADGAAIGELSAHPCTGLAMPSDASCKLWMQEIHLLEQQLI